MICREWVWKGWTLVTEQRSSCGFYGSSYEGGLGVTDKTFPQCNLWGVRPRTSSEERSILPLLPFVGFLPHGAPPSPWLSFPFILVFSSLSMSTCKFYFLGYRPVLSIDTQSGWGWLEKLNSMVWSMGLSDAGFYTTVLAAFSFVLSCPCTEFVLFFRRFVRCRA